MFFLVQLQRLGRFIRLILDRTIETFACLLTVVMVLAVCWQVISRYILNSPSTLTEEFLRFALVWLSAVGLAYVAGRNEHISLTLFLDKCPENIVRYWKVVIQIIFIFFAYYILISGGMKYAHNAAWQISPVLQVSMEKVYFILPISGVMTIIYSLLNITDLLIKNNHPKILAKENK